MPATLPDPLAMSRLHAQQRRLYLALPHGGAGQPGVRDDGDHDLTTTAPDDAALVDASGRVRALVLELARPADWAVLARVWHGVQAELEWPAPAIAVSGSDGYQLWFSLIEPLPAAQAAALLDALRLRYLADMPPRRVTLLPTPPAGATAAPVRHARLVPAAQQPGGPWSAYVTPDLAPVFADEPWLDQPPTPEAQARLLAQLRSIQAGDLHRALALLQPDQPVPAPETEAAPGSVTVSAATAAPPLSTGAPAAAPVPAPVRAPADGAARDPRRFLLDVMNDDSVALGLRIEAAKALLPYI
ncbi:MAG: hypothetical protein RLZZ584_2351 [Pseudomonadota bacterium]